ncbi:NlpC/P60 family protein [Antarcticibacterium flavum]|uniref:NlpC/P60 family protein n=1 Tax=Antarcticibacterium flavum TaxID=2058175 RepID=A0A5B7WXQ7_9FLAO|nr:MULTISPECIES: C40 family peptidase [Antarcticibacterium]MCM4161827.1 hydrolase Nlp/P60 [Antarcticibacterium sp. W02-3]QCY67944.1 NlpC/P60 family protein [Antarcticibacterium flavum]
MQYGICNLSIVPVRNLPADTAEMVTQLLYGESFKILEERGKWSRIRNAFDSSEGWINNRQLFKIPEETFIDLQDSAPIYSSDLIEFITEEAGNLMAIPIGSLLNYASLQDFTFEGNILSGNGDRKALIDTALLYLNTPYLWGGKTPFGIDSSGFTQMVYRLNGYHLLRNSAQQATQGEALSFIEESEPGDLAFFDDAEGVITHVGIIMTDNYIIHADGKVRIDRLDHSGIFNAELRRHTHQLRVIKKIL